MAIIINSKAPCNTVDFPYNKEKKTKNYKIPELKIDSKKIALKYTELGIVILKPCIDKLCFGFPVKAQFLAQYNPYEDVEKIKEGMAKSLYQDAMADSEGTGVSLAYKKTGNDTNKYRFLYKPPSSSSSIFLQFTPKASLFLLVVMNPAKFSEKAIEEFRDFIEYQFLLSGVHIPYDDLMVWSKIYRLDVAVDILGARPADLEVMAMTEKGPVPYKSHTYKSITGRTETLYLIPKSGKTSTGYFYDKQREQIDAGKTPVYGDFLHTRYECRISHTTFYKLPDIQNRCARVSVRAMAHKQYTKMGYTRRLFIRHVLERRDLDKVLELIPDKQKLKYRKSYEDVFFNAWDAKKLWAFWSDALKSLATISPK